MRGMGPSTLDNECNKVLGSGPEIQKLQHAARRVMFLPHKLDESLRI